MFTLTATDDSKVFTFKAEGRKFTLTQHTKSVAEVSPATVKKGLRPCTTHVVTENNKPATVVLCDFPCTHEEALNASRTKIDGFRAIPCDDIEKALTLAVCMLKG